jgi:hypothetical protein
MGQGDVPASPGGPLRRRRERRQLGQLADRSEREVSPTAAKGHVRVIEDKAAEKEEGEPKGQELERQEENTPWMENRPSGFQVRPVPIDQPFSEA